MGRKDKKQARLLCGAAMLSLATFAGVAHAEDTAHYQIPPQSLDSALRAFGAQSGHPILVSSATLDAKRSPGLFASADPETALRKLLAGTGLSYKRNGEVFAIVVADVGPRVRVISPVATAAAETVSGSAVEGLVVTAQKRREAIQDVPIAISAFSADALQAQKIEGGFDLLKAIPNVTFSKNNFSGYNFSIRGIGTKAISVTTDPGVAVSFNDTTLIRNRLFEQEYFDVERVEVLRGPQGTLYGRNATSGVINLVSAKSDLDEFDGQLKGEIGNYQARRLSGMVNVPLIEGVLGVRFAGAMTEREGYSFNLYNREHQDGRDLWSGRLSIGFQPTERVRADLIWERFHEDDDRSRTGKQLCTHDSGPDEIGGVVFPARDAPLGIYNRGYFSQGCLPGSLYDDKAFGTPNGLAIPFVLWLQNFGIGEDPSGGCSDFALGCTVIQSDTDPYGNLTQSRDLRELYSQIKPIYRADADIYELNFNVDLTSALTFTSQTAYNTDDLYSSQDFNRYTTLPVFRDTASLTLFDGVNPSLYRNLAPGGFFCDPQVGCSNTIVGVDISRAKSDQFTQEFRLQSSFDGPVNFSAGLGYTRYRTVEDYYVFFNGITISAITLNSFSAFLGGRDPSKRTINPDCSATDSFDENGLDGFVCVPIESNPIGAIQDTGHNYFLSRNPYKLNSKAAFGEVYWEASETFKITAGLRYTDDRKTFTPVPSQTLLSDPARVDRKVAETGIDFFSVFKSFPIFSFASGSYPAQPNIELGWQEVTGRLGFDWKPDLSFTDQTLLYAFYSRGYKGGGMNPPRIGLNYEGLENYGVILAPSAPPDFRPEFINAYELGAKNTLLEGGLIFNANAFLYDYKDYQVSKIVDRSANNENFDAKVWGMEFESIFSPTPNLRINASLGYLDTELAEGSKSIDILNRTAGDANWVVIKPSILLTSNCIAPVDVVAKVLAAAEEIDQGFYVGSQFLCPGGNGLGGNYANRPPFGITLPDGTTYDPADHPEANYGAGIYTDLSGKELPNAPHLTFTLGGQYSWDLLDGWNATMRGDFYWQSQQWARVYELPIDKLHAWSNTNLSLWLEKPEEDLKFEFYIKNVFNETPITDTFTNSDDTALTTNIFVLDPRLIGLSVTKGF